MKKEIFFSIGIVIIFLVMALIYSINNSPSPVPEVIIYTSVDQVYSEPILKKFERETGIVVKPVYDVEAAKTTGLVNRLIAERENPTADIFWSGEFAQTILLKEKGILSSYVPQNATDIPDIYKDPEGYWTGIGGRARIFLVNTGLLKPEEYPEKLTDMLNGSTPAYRIGIANPLFGTTATHAAALYAYLGEKNASMFFKEISDNGIRVVDGNSAVKDMVSRGELAYGLTDTDDACMALIDNPTLKIIIPDQKEGEMGTLVIPNTVCLINGGKHRKEAEKLYEFLVSPDSERRFIDDGWVQLSVRPGVHSATCINLSTVKGMNLTFDEIYDTFNLSKIDLTLLYIR